MGIIRGAEWLLTCRPNEALTRIQQAMATLSMHPTLSGWTVTGSARRSLVKSRWAAQVHASAAPSGTGTAMVLTVEMNGNKHFALLDEIAEALGDQLFDDRGISAAVSQLNGPQRPYGRREIRHLHNLLSATERVLALGQGTYKNKPTLLTLTTKRVLFFDKDLGGESIEELPLTSISSLSIGKRNNGETLTIHATGNNVQIERMGSGHADGMARAFRAARQSPRANRGAMATAVSPADQLAQLTALHASGALSDDEFRAAKVRVLG